MTDQTAEQKEIETLREHNAELLADLKKARRKITELSEQAETLSTERDGAKDELVSITLQKPVEAMLERVSVLPEHFQTEFKAKGYSFELEDGKVVIKTSDGSRAMLIDGYKKSREAQFTEDDLKCLVLEEWLPVSERSPHAENFTKLVVGSWATGGGARGSNKSAPNNVTTQRPAERLPAGLI